MLFIRGVAEVVVGLAEHRLAGDVGGDGGLAAAERLRGGDDVGDEAGVAHEVEEAAGLAPARVDLVEDEHDVVGVAELAQPAQELLNGAAVMVDALKGSIRIA